MVEEDMNSRQRVISHTGKNIPIDLDEMKRASSKSILEDLFELLEEYAPAWYTEEHHNRAVTALLNRAS
jgi:hypothetical protein